MLSQYRGPAARKSIDLAASANAEDSEAPPTVLPSSTELFYFYGQNLESCAKLSNKRLLFDLCALWKKWLRIYAEDVLIAGMKRYVRAASDSTFLEVKCD